MKLGKNPLARYLPDYRKPDWWRETADVHAAADARCGRTWQCCCVACRLAREAGYKAGEKGTR